MPKKKLWLRLRQKQVSGFKFRRQHPIEPYIADFACIEAKLIIELDGGQHAKHIAHDQKRDRFLQQKGFRVLRFWNNEVLENIEGVMHTIIQTLDLDPHLTSPLQGEELETL